MSAGDRDRNTEFLELKASLFDSVTRLPAYSGCFRQLRKMAADNSLGVIFIQVSDLENIEAVVGFEGYEKLLKRAAFLLQDINNREFGGGLLVTQRGVFDDQFLVFVPDRLFKEKTSQGLEEPAQKLFKSLLRGLADHNDIDPSIRIGVSLLLYNPFLRFERHVHRVVNETALAIQRETTTAQTLRGLELDRILEAEKITSVYQPIVSLEDFSIMGFEALARGPAGTPYERPDTLFSLAKEARLSHKLDELCKKKAIMGAGLKPEGTKLFINTLPNTLSSQRFLGKDALDWLGQMRMNPADIVWELNERQNIKDYSVFSQLVEKYQALGYIIAIDDLGTGYSSLETTAHVRPSYVKADRSLVKGISQNLLKQELVASLGALAKTIKAELIVEGIETKDDLAVLSDMGLKYGQGFLFGRPSSDFILKVGL